MTSIIGSNPVKSPSDVISLFKRYQKAVGKESQLIQCWANRIFESLMNNPDQWTKEFDRVSNILSTNNFGKCNSFELFSLTANQLRWPLPDGWTFDEVYDYLQYAPPYRALVFHEDHPLDNSVLFIMSDNHKSSHTLYLSENSGEKAIRVGISFDGRTKIKAYYLQ